MLGALVKFCDQLDNFKRSDLKINNGEKYVKLYSQKLVDVMRCCIQNKNVKENQKKIM